VVILALAVAGTKLASSELVTDPLDDAVVFVRQDITPLNYDIDIHVHKPQEWKSYTGINGKIDMQLKLGRMKPLGAAMKAAGVVKSTAIRLFGSHDSAVNHVESVIDRQDASDVIFLGMQNTIITEATLRVAPTLDALEQGQGEIIEVTRVLKLNPPQPQLPSLISVLLLKKDMPANSYAHLSLEYQHELRDYYYDIITPESTLFPRIVKDYEAENLAMKLAISFDPATGHLESDLPVESNEDVEIDGKPMKKTHFKIDLHYRENRLSIGLGPSS
jgi:hypothetical protein